MAKTPKDKDQDEADKRRDELAKRVLKLPPAPKVASPKAKKPKARQTGV